MSNILDINTTLKPTYDEWNNSHQCVGFVKGTQIQGLGIPYGSFGNGKDVTKNLVKNYGYVDLKGNLKRGCVVSLGATSTNSYGHVVMINDMDSTYVWVAEGNYNGTSAGEYRESYKQTIADFKKRNGGVVGTAIHPKWNTTSSTPTPKTFKAVRENKSKDNGTFYFDEKYYNDLKDGTQAYDAVDTKGNTWAATTTWTKVYAPEGSSTEEIKGYSFNECYGYHPDTNKLCWFDIELYGSTQDDVCFEIGNLKKNPDGTMTLLKDEDGYVKGTLFRKVKTTFYK